LGESDYTPKPKMPDNLVAFSETYHQLPYGTGQRSAALRSAEGQAYIAYLNQNRIYNNQERQKLGLPLLEDPSAKYSSSGGGGSRSGGGSFAISMGKASVRSGRSKISLKAKTKKSSKRVAKSTGKPKVSIKKALV
jgi:hypothetical protein